MARPTENDEKSAFAERLKRALTQAGVRHSPTILANEFNLRYWGRAVSPHTARTWLHGISIPTQDKLRVLANWLQISPDELRFGASPSASVARDGAIDYTLSGPDRELLRRYLALSLASKKTVQEVVTALYVAQSGRS